MSPGRLLALLLVAAAARAEAAPWALGAQRFSARLGYQGVRSTTLVAPDGMKFDIPRFVTDDLDLGLAWGIDDRFTLIANLPLLRSSDLDDTPDELTREAGFGDVQVGLEAQLARRGPWAFGVRGLVQAPTGDAERADGLQPTGSGVWEGEAAFSAGVSFLAGKGWLVGEGGYHYRGGGLEDGVVYSVNAGWVASRRVSLAIGLRGVQPFRYPDGSFATGSLTGVGNGVTFANYGPSLFVKLGGGLSLDTGVERTFHARNLATGTLFRAGLTYRR